MIKKLCNSGARSGSGFSNGLCRNEGIICKSPHPKSFAQVVDGSGNCAKAIGGHFPTGDFKTTAAVKIASGVDEHHAKNQFGDCICILSWSVHGSHTLGLTSFQVNVVITST